MDEAGVRGAVKTAESGVHCKSMHMEVTVCQSLLQAIKIKYWLWSSAFLQAEGDQ